MDNLNKMKELADKIARYLCDCQNVNTSWQYPAIIGIMKDYYIIERPATPAEESTDIKTLIHKIWNLKPLPLETEGGMDPELLEEATKHVVAFLKRKE
jgi:hypothetical protein